MIDGVKIVFYSLTIVKDLLRLGAKVLSPLEEDTGEIHFPLFAEYRNLRFKISQSNRVEISGSLHKYWKGENYSDFTFIELCECISDLCGKFNINPLEARLHNLEFGVNVCPAFNPFEFCGRLIAFKKESFAKYRTTGKRKVHIGFEAVQQQYAVKCYDKGRQYLKNDNILRLEVRATKMIFLKSIGVNFLSDLTKPETLISLGELLNEIFSELIICERVNLSELSINERRIYALCSNPKEWERFTPKQRYKRKRQFEEITRVKGQTGWKETTAKLIRDKWAMLLVIHSLKSGDVLTEHTATKSEDKLTGRAKPEGDVLTV